MNRSILVTGGAGYIGSHSCVEFLDAGYDVVAVDNLDNSSEEAIRRVRKITGKDMAFHQIDLLDIAELQRLFDIYDFEAVVHFAGLKAVGESSEIPLRYYHNNLTGTLNLLNTMHERKVRKLVFSSSATVYGEPERVPVTEDKRGWPTNPYGRTKLFIEEMCRDVARMPAEPPPWKIVLLRYFNPVGAHSSGIMGEDPRGIPNNLMPFILQVAVGRRPHVSVFGDDYPTPDGTGVRDYIHVVDLSKGHVAALDAIDRIDGCVAINLGTGRGNSVLEMVRAVEEASGKTIPYEIAPRRAGDVPELYADPSLAKEILGWEATLTLEDICIDGWRWQSANPNGYDD
jgi:UDP-glucose 4-epimerase